MTTPRRLVLATLTAATGVLGVANLIVWRQGRASVYDGPAGQSEAWQRWQELPTALRLEYVMRYETLMAREDAGTVFQRTRGFMHLPAAEQEHLRAVYRLMSEAVAAQPAAQRGDLARSPERARAFLLYQLLRRTDAQRLEELRAAAHAIKSGLGGDGAGLRDEPG